MRERRVSRFFPGQSTRDGAGVRLRRVFGFGNTAETDPFLLFDAFGSKNPSDYLAGFPWHPHRGIETVTYMLSGQVRHGDSLGNSGIIGAGEVQWMTAGSGIIHEEMPLKAEGELAGFQLWVNLPRNLKLCEPRYRGLSVREIPRHSVAPGVSVGLIAGRLGDLTGPLTDIALSPVYFDAWLDAGAEFEFQVKEGYTAFSWLYEGSLVPMERQASHSVPEAGIRAPVGLLFEREGTVIRFVAGSSGCRFVCAAGKPLGEPVAWRGPIVMNSDEELDLAFRELEKGTFIRSSIKK